MERWSGRVAIVTGASAGIGAGIAQILVENGMKVVGVARRTDPIKEMRAEFSKYSGELHAIEGDVTKEEDVKRIVKWTRENLGGVDVLVNNAGVALGCPLTDFDTEKFRRVWETNVFGLSLFTREAIKDMRERGVNGHIFHISSVMGQKVTNIERFPHLGVYSSTKHAVKTLTEYLRQELRDANSEIKITSISPGLVKTDIVTAASGSEQTSEDVFEINPTLTIRDVAETLLFALSTPPSVQIHELVVQPMGERF